MKNQGLTNSRRSWKKNKAAIALSWVSNALKGLRLFIAITAVCGAGCIAREKPKASIVPSLEPTRSPQISTIAPTRAASPTTIHTKTPAPPTAPATPKPDCRKSPPQIQELVYPGVVVKEEIPVIVFLPPCYTTDTEIYPVVFLLHGFPFDETQWMTLGAFDLAEQAILSNRWPDAILVLPKLPAPIFTQSDGGSNSYEREFLGGVLPFITENYRLSDDPRDWSLAGISRGGVWALEIALRAPWIFNRVAAISPSLNVNYARHIYDPFWLVMNDAKFHGTILIAVGEDDHSVRVRAEDFRDVLDEAGVPYLFLLEPGSHDTDFWMSVVDPVLGFLIANER